MARILYGVMGDARGHVSRALTVAQEMSDHDFLFIGGGRVHDLEAEGYHVEDVPMASTLYRGNRVDIPATAINAVRVFLTSGAPLRRVCDIITHFDPDLILTDYEYFTPLAARRLGRLCISLDHQHVLTHCKYEPPREQRLSRLMTCSSIRHLYSSAAKFVIISFFRPEPIDSKTTFLTPPIIRSAVKERAPSDGDHVVVYQTSPTFYRLLPILERMSRTFFIYGLGEKNSARNLVFKPPSTEGFLHDLASCRYVISNGGHNVISEALYFGKPVFSFPIDNAYEQFLNAYFLAAKEFGDYSISSDVSTTTLESFESRLDRYRDMITREDFFGNPQIVATLEQFLRKNTQT
jgi:uncharacterized protein (TIGR00661 family)